MLQITYLRRLSPKLQLFSEKGYGRFNFRCPYCGDSQKDPTKARGNFKPHVENREQLVYKCFNCGKTRGFEGFLRDNDSNLYQEYKLEKMQVEREDPSELFGDPDPEPEHSGSSGRSKRPTPDELFVRCDMATDHRDVSDYLDRRGLTPYADRLYYTQDWRGVIRDEFDDSIYTGYLSSGPTDFDRRLVIPIFDPSGSKLIALQGRALGDIEPKYLTVHFDRSYPLLYGVEQININSQVLIMEGALDAIFVWNAVAVCGSHNDPSEIREIIPHRVWYLDQEPRNHQIVERMKDLIESGETVVIHDDPTFINADVNDVVLKGVSPDEVREKSLESAYRGVRALTKLAWWRKDR